MKVIHHSIIYENPLPQLRSRQSLFPWLCEMSDGSLLASHCIGEAFESVDGTSYLSTSRDGGKTFSKPKLMFEQDKRLPNSNDTCKITYLNDGRLIALGYAYDRSNPELPIGNPETGGLLDDYLFVSYSSDQGDFWSQWEMIDCSWGPHVEASAPLTVLKSGAWITPITGFAKWDGSRTGRNCGRILRSDNEGETWSDDTICMEFEGDEITCYEQRLCQLDSGTVVCIGWNEDLRTGKLFNNHYTLSHDDGRTFSAPIDTGIGGQASSVCAIGGEKLLALHALRKDTNRPGIYGYIVDLSSGSWDIEEELLIWKPQIPIIKNEKMADVFSFLKFGQPGAILLCDGDVLVSYWCEEQGVYKTCTARIQL